MYSYLHIKNNKECYQPYKVEVKVKFVNAYNALRMGLNTEKALNKYCSKIYKRGDSADRPEGINGGLTVTSHQT